MMAGNTVCCDLRRNTVLCRHHAQHFLSAGSGVVDTFSDTGYISLEAVRIFSEIVEHSAQRAQASGTKFSGASGCQSRYVNKMIGQRLPLTLVLVLYRMGKIHSI